MRYRQGELTIALMGDLLRNPGTAMRDAQERLEVEDPAVIRVTIGRLMGQGKVREVGSGYMLTRAGLEYLATIRRYVTAEN